VPVTEFDSFRDELSALLGALDQLRLKTLRDETLRERFRTLFRSWTSNVQPTIRDHVSNKRELLKLNAELEKIAQLTSKNKRVAEYRTRLRKARELANLLVLSVPSPQSLAPPTQHQGLFLPEIPDLRIAMVPDQLIGCRSKMKDFLQQHPFDRSVFIMIRYRGNAKLISAVKTAVTSCEINHKPFFPVLARDHKLTNDLYNPIACLLCCSLGIAIFDKEKAGETYNPNVAYELGMMHLLNRTCLLLKHQSLKNLQTDILMKLYENYSGPQSAAKLVQAWEPLTPAAN
jgi:hypothetical protein